MSTYHLTNRLERLNEEVGCLGEDLFEKRREILTENGGDFAGGALLGLVYTTFVFFIREMAGGTLSGDSLILVGIATITLLSWGSRVFYASVLFIASYAGAGIVASLIYRYYSQSYFVLYSFLLGSVLGYVLSVIEVSVFGSRRSRSEKEELAEEAGGK